MRATLLCAWCGHKIGETDTPTGRPARGICDPCLLHYYGLTPEQLFAHTIPELHRERQEAYLQGHLPFRMTKWT